MSFKTKRFLVSFLNFFNLCKVFVQFLRTFIIIITMYVAMFIFIFYCTPRVEKLRVGCSS